MPSIVLHKSHVWHIITPTVWTSLSPYFPPYYILWTEGFQLSSYRVAILNNSVSWLKTARALFISYSAVNIIQLVWALSIFFTKKTSKKHPLSVFPSLFSSSSVFSWCDIGKASPSKLFTLGWPLCRHLPHWTVVGFIAFHFFPSAFFSHGTATVRKLY